VSEDAVSAYDERAGEYAQALGSMSATASADRARVEEWAESSSGPLLDLGCGPGQWTAHLAGRGHDVLGIDPSHAFVRIARETHPGVRYLEGGLEDLVTVSGRYGGILAWYSLIHLPPVELRPALEILHEALAPDGQLLLGFFDGPELAPFDHAVATAWRWPVQAVTELAGECGFEVTDATGRTDPGSRPHGDVSARRRA
jgi:SAM-dependent methyltransferase